MDKKWAKVIAVLTLIVVIVLTVSVTTTINAVNQTATDNCFNELRATTLQIADDFRSSMLSDRRLLAAISRVITTNNDAFLTQSNTFLGEMPYIGYLALLTPDGRLTKAGGTVADGTKQLDFDAEVKKGEYISPIVNDAFEPNKKVLMSGVPVVRDGEVVAMLYGVIYLNTLAGQYTTDIYNGNAYVYLVDGDSGDFMLDTWHKTLGNISELGERQTLPGYSLNDSLSDLKNGEEGSTGFISRTTGQILYMQYAPVGINNWSVILTVDKDSAMKSASEISFKLYVLAGIVGSVQSAYMLVIIIWLYKAYRTAYRYGQEDQTTGVLNRNAFEQQITRNNNRTFDSVTCIYMDVNGLHEVNNRYGHGAGDRMLQTLSIFLKKEFPSKCVYRIGGDEFVVLYDGNGQNTCEEKAAKVAAQMKEHGYSVSIGLVCRKNETGLSEIIKEADKKMLENKREYYVCHNRRDGGKPFQ